MKEFEGKVAFVTGAASGIGLGIAKAFAARGMKVMMADIENETLQKAVASLQESNGQVEGVLCDVSDVEAVRHAAKKTIEVFGKVHVLVNNAGVGGGGGETGSIPLEDWKWTVDVNLMGVVYGCETFVPLIKEHGEGGYIINTASMAGQVGAPGMGPYNATKFAVVGYTESMNAELVPQGIGVAALCPAWVNTQIINSRRNHPAGAESESGQVGMLDDMEGIVAEAISAGMSPDTVGKWVVESMEQEAQYIFTHPNWKIVSEAKAQRVHQAYDAAAQSPTIQADPGALSSPMLFPDATE
ncbi:MAG: NAD(P)-dependent dehydrogenase (short-subunit alcohol dehydrogenase family) [Oceanicoccus sp.]|jgi:NAD(P)-dependent dehydrogenase (short-subunit alcohol dehydrogenase family)